MQEEKLCANCAYWREKSHVTKSWGICDNPKNEVKIGLRGHLHGFVTDDLIETLEGLIRYPEDFGCIFFSRKQ